MGRTAIYRHFDADGVLLYVGISLNAVSRLAQHRLSAGWFDRISRVEIEWHPSRDAALAAERDAIKAERPAHNDKHRPDRPLPKHIWEAIERSELGRYASFLREMAKAIAANEAQAEKDDAILWRKLNTSAEELADRL